VNFVTRPNDRSLGQTLTADLELAGAAAARDPELVLTKPLVELQGRRILVDSAGKGSTFRSLLPAGVRR
jgi:hypothetical protein